MKRRAMTLLEIMVASSILLLMMGVLFSVYRMGASAMMKGTVHTELVQETNVACHRLTREVERSIYLSLSSTSAPAAPGVSFLSAVNGSDLFAYDNATTMPRWQNFLIFYYDPVALELRLRKVPTVGTPTEGAPRTIELFGAALPLATYLTGGTVVSRSISACAFNVTPEQQLIMEITAQKKRYGSPTPESYKQRTLVNFRN